MLRVTIMLEPGGDQSRTRSLAEITIANITRAVGRMSDDYAWRIKMTDRGGREIVAYGSLVDSYNGNAVELLHEVLREWKSGRPLPIDNHGHAVSLIDDLAVFWRDIS